MSSVGIPINETNAGEVAKSVKRIQDEFAKPFEDAEMPPRRGDLPIVAVRVRGDSMSGVLEDGWTVYYEDRREPPDESHYGKLCVVGLKDGRALVKKLYQGRRPRHYDLHSINAPPELDQPVEWAARVVWIKPV